MKLHKKGMLASGFSAILCVLFVLLFFLGEWTAAGMTRDLDALNAGERWSADGEPYATITLHTASESALSLNQVESYAMAIESGLRSASIESSESGRVWTYSYFAEDLVTVSGPKAQAPLRTIAAGGSFFTFHPLEFVYGAPFAYDRALPDGIVLDEDAAWRIFGAVDVVGMTVQIGGRDMTVTGIVRHERQTDGYEKAYGEIPRMYMSYYGYEAIFGTDSSITTYEVTLPNPVKAFAMNIFETAVKINEDTMVIRENSDRYSLTNRFNRMKELPFMGMRNDRIVYPYFENELQVTDYFTSVWMIWQTIAASLAVLSLLASLICLFVSGFSFTAILKMAWKKAEKSLEDRKKNKKHKRHRRKKDADSHPLKPEKYLEDN